jgi:hypothetical protein
MAQILLLLLFSIAPHQLLHRLLLQLLQHPLLRLSLRLLPLLPSLLDNGNLKTLIVQRVARATLV